MNLGNGVPNGRFYLFGAQTPSSLPFGNNLSLLLALPIHYTWAFLADPAGSYNMKASIPPDSKLVGLAFYLQAIQFEMNQFQASNAVEVLFTP